MPAPSSLTHDEFPPSPLTHDEFSPSPLTPDASTEFGDTRAVVKLSGYSQAVNSAGQFAFVVIGIAISVVMPLILGT